MLTDPKELKSNLAYYWSLLLEIPLDFFPIISFVHKKNYDGKHNKQIPTLEILNLKPLNYLLLFPSTTQISRVFYTAPHGALTDPDDTATKTLHNPLQKQHINRYYTSWNTAQRNRFPPSQSDYPVIKDMSIPYFRWRSNTQKLYFILLPIC